MELSRQEYWSGLPFSFLQGIFPTLGSNLSVPALKADALPSEHQGRPKTVRFPRQASALRDQLSRSPLHTTFPRLFFDTLLCRTQTVRFGVRAPPLQPAVSIATSSPLRALGWRSRPWAWGSGETARRGCPPPRRPLPLPVLCCASSRS